MGGRWFEGNILVKRKGGETDMEIQGMEIFNLGMKEKDGTILGCCDGYPVVIPV